MSLELDRSQWKRVKFADVVRNVNETVKDPSTEGIDRIIAMEHLDPGELQINQWGYIADGTTFTRRVRCGQTLFGKRRSYQRKAAYAEFDAICSGDILVFEAIESMLLPELLPFLVQSEGFYANAVGTSAGSLSPRTNWKDLSAYKFELPPLDQQQRVADLLWAIEAEVQAQRRRAAASKLTAQALIEGVRRDTADSRPLSEVAEIRNGQTFPKRFQGREDGEVAFFKVSDLDSPGNERWLTRPANWISTHDLESLKARPFPTGTIVTVRVGAALRLERRRILSQPALVDDNHLVIQSRGIDSQFLWAFLSETRLSESRNDGVVPSLNQGILGAVKIPVLPDAEYERIGVIYSAGYDAAASCGGEIVMLKELQRSVFKRILGAEA